ncbi:MAG: helix-turn-helix domain-containing protein [Pseudomonadota bacterium]
MDERQEIKSLLKGLDVLLLINTYGPQTVTQVATAMGYPRGTSHRILETLTVGGYLERDQINGTYALRIKVRSLATGYIDQHWIETVAEPAIRRLAEDVSWPLALAIPRADEMVVHVATDHHTTLVIERFMPGYSVPLLHTTSGWCTLAFTSEAKRTAMLDLIATSEDPLQAAIHDRAHLLRQLATIRTKGYSIIKHPQYREGSMSVPVFGRAEPVGGLIMRFMKSAIEHRKLIHHYLPRLQKTAEIIHRGIVDLHDKAT